MGAVHLRLSRQCPPHFPDPHQGPHSVNLHLLHNLRITDVENCVILAWEPLSNLLSFASVDRRIQSLSIE